MGRQLNIHEPNPMKVSTYIIWILYIPLGVYVSSAILLHFMKCLSRQKYNRLVLLFSGQTFEEVFVNNDENTHSNQRDVNQRSCRLMPGFVIPAEIKSDFYSLYAYSFPTQITFLLAYALNSVLIERVYEETCFSYLENKYTNDPHYTCTLKNVNTTSNMSAPDDVCSSNATTLFNETIYCHSYFYDSNKIIIVLGGIYGLHKLLAIMFVCIIAWDQYWLKKAIKIARYCCCCGPYSAALIYMGLSVLVLYAPALLIIWILGRLKEKSQETTLSLVVLWPVAAFFWSCLMISYNVVKSYPKILAQPYQSASGLVITHTNNVQSNSVYSTNHTNNDDGDAPT